MKNKNRENDGENDGLGMWKIRIERMMDWVCEKEWVGEKEWITWVGLDIGKSEFQEVSNYLKCWLYLKNAINDFFFYVRKSGWVRGSGSRGWVWILGKVNFKKFLITWNVDFI